MGSEELVTGVLKDLDSSGLSESEKVLFRFVDKVNRHSASITASDMEPLHQAGWSDWVRTKMNQSRLPPGFLPTPKNKSPRTHSGIPDDVRGD